MIIIIYIHVYVIILLLYYLPSYVTYYKRNKLLYFLPKCRVIILPVNPLNLKTKVSRSTDHKSLRTSLKLWLPERQQSECRGALTQQPDANPIPPLPHSSASPAQHGERSAPPHTDIMRCPERCEMSVSVAQSK